MRIDLQLTAYETGVYTIGLQQSSLHNLTITRISGNVKNTNIQGIKTCLNLTLPTSNLNLKIKFFNILKYLDFIMKITYNYALMYVFIKKKDRLQY